MNRNRAKQEDDSQSVVRSSDSSTPYQENRHIPSPNQPRMPSTRSADAGEGSRWDCLANSHQQSTQGRHRSQRYAIPQYPRQDNLKDLDAPNKPLQTHHTEQYGGDTFDARWLFIAFDIEVFPVLYYVSISFLLHGIGMVLLYLVVHGVNLPNRAHYLLLLIPMVTANAALALISFNIPLAISDWTQSRHETKAKGDQHDSEQEPRLTTYSDMQVKGKPNLIGHRVPWSGSLSNAAGHFPRHVASEVSDDLVNHPLTAALISSPMTENRPSLSLDSQRNSELAQLQGWTLADMEASADSHYINISPELVLIESDANDLHSPSVAHSVQLDRRSAAFIPRKQSVLNIYSPSGMPDDGRIKHTGIHYSVDGSGPTPSKQQPLRQLDDWSETSEINSISHSDLQRYSDKPDLPHAGAGMSGPRGGSPSYSRSQHRLTKNSLGNEHRETTDMLLPDKAAPLPPVRKRLTEASQSDHQTGSPAPQSASSAGAVWGDSMRREGPPESMDYMDSIRCMLQKLAKWHTITRTIAIYTLVSCLILHIFVFPPLFLSFCEQVPYRHYLLAAGDYSRNTAIIQQASHMKQPPATMTQLDASVATESAKRQPPLDPIDASNISDSNAPSPHSRRFFMREPTPSLTAGHHALSQMGLEPVGHSQTVFSTQIPRGRVRSAGRMMESYSPLHPPPRYSFLRWFPAAPHVGFALSMMIMTSSQFLLCVAVLYHIANGDRLISRFSSSLRFMSSPHKSIGMPLPLGDEVCDRQFQR